jgi:hypothetical protein
MAQVIECRPFCRIRLEPASVLIKRPQPELIQPVTDPLAHLATNLAEACPSQPKSWQRPLQENNAFLVAHRRAASKGERSFPANPGTRSHALPIKRQREASGQFP